MHSAVPHAWFVSCCRWRCRAKEMLLKKNKLVFQNHTIVLGAGTSLSIVAPYRARSNSGGATKCENVIRWHGGAQKAVKFHQTHLRMAGAYSAILNAVLLASAGLVCTANTGRSLLSEADHKYQKGEKVKIYANKVGPFHNPR